jgi:hypothetical protein
LHRGDLTSHKALSSFGQLSLGIEEICSYTRGEKKTKPKLLFPSSLWMGSIIPILLSETKSMAFW